VTSRSIASSLWTVLPVSGIDRGKTRLAPVLGQIERARLNRWLLEHTLRVIAAWRGGLGRCIVVSGCARTLRLARAAGAIALREPQPRRGLNHAIAHAVRRALRCGARRVLILPCDLPALTATALDALIARSRPDARVVIAPDRDGTGTNALFLGVRARFAFTYGPGSFERHLAAARSRGWVAAVCARPELTLDLDTPHDLAAWEGAAAARRPLPRMV
jgi:2-phospho-L-lactate guanylyltransferase